MNFNIQHLLSKPDLLSRAKVLIKILLIHQHRRISEMLKGQESLDPFPVNPSVEEVQAGFGLIQGNHVARSMKPHEGEVAAALDLADFAAVGTEFQVFHLDLIEGLLARPFQGFSPCLVAQPIADKVSVTLTIVSRLFPNKGVRDQVSMVSLPHIRELVSSQRCWGLDGGMASSSRLRAGSSGSHRSYSYHNFQPPRLELRERVVD